MVLARASVPRFIDFVATSTDQCTYKFSAFLSSCTPPTRKKSTRKQEYIREHRRRRFAKLSQAENQVTLLVSPDSTNHARCYLTTASSSFVFIPICFYSDASPARREFMLPLPLAIVPFRFGPSEMCFDHLRWQLIADHNE